MVINKIDNLRKVKLNKHSLYDEIKELRNFSCIWTIIRSLSEIDVYHNIYQHNLIRQLIIFKRQQQTDKLILIENLCKVLKSKLVNNKWNVDISFLDSFRNTDPVLNIQCHTIGVLVDHKNCNYIYYSRYFRGIFMRYANRLEEYENSTIDDLKLAFSKIKTKNEVKKILTDIIKLKPNIRGKENYFWCTKNNLIESFTEKNGEDIHYLLGLGPISNPYKDYIITFKIPLKENHIFQPTFFADFGNFYRPQFRNDKWGETVCSNNLLNGVPEGLAASLKLSTNINFDTKISKPSYFNNALDYENHFKKFYCNSINDGITNW